MYKFNVEINSFNKKTFYKKLPKNWNDPNIGTKVYVTHLTKPFPDGDMLVCEDDLCVIDCDNEETSSFILDIVNLDDTLSIKTSRGYHLYFINDLNIKEGLISGQWKLVSKVLKKEGIDLQGGKKLVMPVWKNIDNGKMFLNNRLPAKLSDIWVKLVEKCEQISGENASVDVSGYREAKYTNYYLWEKFYKEVSKYVAGFTMNFQKTGKGIKWTLEIKDLHTQITKEDLGKVWSSDIGRKIIKLYSLPLNVNDKGLPVIPSGCSYDVLLRFGMQLLSDVSLNYLLCLSIMYMYDWEGRQEPQVLLPKEMCLFQAHYQGRMLMTTLDVGNIVELFCNIEDGDYLLVEYSRGTIVDTSNADIVDEQEVRHLMKVLNVYSYSSFKKLKTVVKSMCGVEIKEEVVPVVKIVNTTKKLPGYDMSNRELNVNESGMLRWLVTRKDDAGVPIKPDWYDKHIDDVKELGKFLIEIWGENALYILYVIKEKLLNPDMYTPLITQFCGKGGTGKTLSVLFLSELFGSSSIVTPEIMKDKHRTFVMQENIIFEEVGDWSENDVVYMRGLVKTITGSNKFTIRELHKQSRTIEIHCKLWVTTNRWVKLHSVEENRRIHPVLMESNLKEKYGKNLDKYVNMMNGSGENRKIRELFMWWVCNELDIDEESMRAFGERYTKHHLFEIPKHLSKGVSFKDYITYTTRESEILQTIFYNSNLITFLLIVWKLGFGTKHFNDILSNIEVRGICIVQLDYRIKPKDMSFTQTIDLKEGSVVTLGELLNLINSWDDKTREKYCKFNWEKYSEYGLSVTKVSVDKINTTISSLILLLLEIKYRGIKVVYSKEVGKVGMFVNNLVKIDVSNVPKEWKITTNNFYTGRFIPLK